MESTDLTISFNTTNKSKINFKDLWSGTLFVYLDTFGGEELLGMKIVSDCEPFSDDNDNDNILNLCDGTFIDYNTFVKNGNKIIRIIKNAEIIEK